MSRTTIEWTDTTWNPVTGCTKVSPGCTYCYAETFAERFRNVPGHPFAQGFDLALRPERLDLPATWKDPRMVFVCSMSDLFHEDIPEDFIVRVFDTMRRTPRHTYQVLTKRAERLLTLSPSLPWASHIWMGVSVENAYYLHRIDTLRQTGAHHRFVSIEPLLSQISHLDLEGIDWVIVGGEPGPKARSIDPAWVRAIRDCCRTQGVPFFFKQWGRATHNPDPHDPTMVKGHPSYAKGGCRLDGAVLWERPMGPEG